MRQPGRLPRAPPAIAPNLRALCGLCGENTPALKPEQLRSSLTADRAIATILELKPSAEASPSRAVAKYHPLFTQRH